MAGFTREQMRGSASDIVSELHAARRPEEFGRQLNDSVVAHPFLFIALAFLIYGFLYTDFPEFKTFVVHPFTLALPADRQYLYSSPLNFFMGAALAGWVGDWAAFCLVAVAGFVFLAIAATEYVRAASVLNRTTSVYVVLSTPILLVLTSWVGKGDPYLVAAYLLLLRLGGRGPLAGGAACVMIMAHREIGTIMLLGDCFLRRRLDAWVVLGAAFGHAGITVYQFAVLPAPPASRAAFAEEHIRTIVHGFTINPISHLLLGFGWFWIPCFLRLKYGEWHRGLLVFLLCLAASLSTFDFTRVFSLACLPLVLQTAEWFSNSPPERRAFITRWPFPLVFLIQAQIIDRHMVVDTNWPHLLQRLLEPAP